jgi:hypothetical protein
VVEHLEHQPHLVHGGIHRFASQYLEEETLPSVMDRLEGVGFFVQVATLTYTSGLVLEPDLFVDLVVDKLVYSECLTLILKVTKA